MGLGLMILGLAAAVAAVVTWTRLRRRRPKPTLFLVIEDLTWFVLHDEVWGPCCITCEVHLMARPLPSRLDGVAQFELCCPACGNVPTRRAFTLAELVSLDREAAQVWDAHRAPATASPPSFERR